MIVVDKRECVGCEECLHVCPTEAIIMKMKRQKLFSTSATSANAVSRYVR